MRKVGDLLEQKNREVIWVEPLASVYEALELMNAENIGALLVQIDGYLVGIVSERDYVRNVILDRQASRLTKVSEIMTRDVVTVHPDQCVLECIDLMKQRGCRHLPVVVDGRAVGIVSLRDLFVDVIERGHRQLNRVA